MKSFLLKFCCRAAVSVILSSTYAQIAMAQNNPTLIPQGRIQLDYTNANGSNSNADFNGLELRRAYIGAHGKIMRNVSYNIDVGVDENGKVTPIVAFVDWKPFKPNFRIRAGQFKSPMSLDESTSSRFTSTIERAAFTDSFNIQRRVGVGFVERGEKHTLSAGFFGGAIDHQPFASGRVIAARATFTPFLQKKKVVHLGASYRHRTDNKDKGPNRYTQRPYSHNTNPILSTGRIAESDTTIIGEAAWVNDKVWVAGEYAVNSAKCATCISDPSFNGYYAEVGMFFRGRKVYKNGKFNRPKVYDPVTEGGRGAFSVVARYDGLDLKDSAIDGGDLKTWILGADWYPTKNIRFGVNYFNSDADLGTSSSRLAPEFIALQVANIRKEKVKGFLIRAQYDF
ncbi:MAG: hypothetical protein COC03_08105 [Robiginitomaculum sp.]|nr:MAG: hypothetical protein COC03_08105 [Robiginitomaculum sp.]PHQ67531.1 MAG: hypothetical protein COB92_04070 [Robiginitomaculum sp.]